jgi:hypothetical protein
MVGEHGGGRTEANLSATCLARVGNSSPPDLPDQAKATYRRRHNSHTSCVVHGQGRMQSVKHGVQLLPLKF